MMKTILISTALFAATALAYDLVDFQNNIIEFKPAPVQEFSRPYPYYNDYKHKIVKAKPLKSYSDSYKVVTPVTEIDVPASSCIITTLISHIFSVSKAVMVFIFYQAPALIFGSIIALVSCKLSSMFNILSGLLSMFDVREEIKELVTPDRVERAAEFVQKALKKYNAMQ